MPKETRHILNLKCHASNPAGWKSIADSVQQRAPHTCAILSVPVKAALAHWAGTLIAAWGVDAAKAAASLIDAAFVHICGRSRK